MNRERILVDDGRVRVIARHSGVDGEMQFRVVGQCDGRTALVAVVSQNSDSARGVWDVARRVSMVNGTTDAIVESYAVLDAAVERAKRLVLDSARERLAEVEDMEAEMARRDRIHARMTGEMLALFQD